jgi:hypothetical protein
MYNFYNAPEKKDTWRSSYEIHVASREHDKFRFQQENAVTFGKPQNTSKKKTRSAWKSIIELTGSLLALLIG